MRDSWLIAVMLAAAAGILLAGCASGPRPTHAAAPPVAASAAPAPPSVKIVERRPSPKRYRFVGVVRATSQSVDLVEAARDAHEDLERQVKKLGADVVKIDVIAPPNDLDMHVRRRVIMSGRAYKARAAAPAGGNRS